jgi:hypothetical protein
MHAHDRVTPLRHIPVVDSELVRIANALCEGTATAADCEALEGILADADALAAYVALMEQHAALTWQNRWRSAMPSWLPPELTAGPDDAPVTSDRGTAVATVPRGRGLAVPLVLGTTMLTAAVLLARLPSPAGRPDVQPPSRAATPFAEITATAQARWAAPRELVDGDALGSGPVRLLEGRALLRFASGATVVLNGPVDLEIVTDNRIFLRSGRITPFVPPAARGFTVVSPSGEVVDLGTEFSVGVDAAGLTSVYVIDGEIDVTTGHARRLPPLRMTQGFGAELSGPAASAPAVTQTPIVIDHFTDDRSHEQPAPVELNALRWTDLDPACPAVVRDGALRIPFRDDPAWADPAVRILLDNDFTKLVGKRSVISYKVTLPPGGTVGVKRWLALVIDGRRDEETPPRVPLAHAEETSAAVMVSPVWQAGVRIDGQRFPCSPLFRRNEDAAGPYRVVVTLDDSPEGRIENGGTRLDVMFNGVEFASSRIIALGDQPRLGFHTYVPRGKGWEGEAWAVVDDFSVSIDTGPRPAEGIDRGAP